MGRVEARLEPGVRLERPPVLDGLDPGRNPGLVERDEVDVERAEELAQLAQLVRGPGGDDDPRTDRRIGRYRRTFASASACAANRRSRPPFARSRSASMSERANGLPSAVPWSSTNVPASVATMFMSTSARESSE
jgi:hypothetical protein